MNWMQKVVGTMIIDYADADQRKSILRECNAGLKACDEIMGYTKLLRSPPPCNPIMTPDWDFVEKSRYLHTFLLSKLSTDLRDKTIGIEDRNGLELYRQVVQSVDQIPDNAKFLMGADIGNLVHKYGDKAKDLKPVYGFRLLLKKRAAEFH